MTEKRDVLEELEECEPQASIPESRAEEMVEAFGVDSDSVDLTPGPAGGLTKEQSRRMQETGHVPRGYGQDITALDVMETILEYHDADPVDSSDVAGADALEKAKEKNLERIENHLIS